ncbi:cytochrome c peroxidase [Flavobacterium sp.]|uniref:cytochrome-c peroxidase n=1 Tax=Flavobacterium sp. TaxID=239 RepID=UPI002611D01A|nr:cytochrome c peroxidase [Flavobacterium sp.]
MRKNSAILGLTIILFSILGFSKLDFTPIYFDVPENFPKPIYNFKNNPLSEEGFELGRKLFYDPILSKDSTISCASCHLQQTGFAHVDHDLSHGIDGKIGMRNALTLQNLAWSKHFQYDGGVNNLEVQPLNPITSAMEMNETVENVVKKLQFSQQYPKLFKQAFGSKKITGQLTLKALAQFVVSLTTSNSKYDKVLRKEDKFTEMEQKGYELFKQNCASCHKEPLFTSDQFENNGLPIDTTLNDFGRMKITQNPTDSLRFKVPTLRNIEFTFPYMHDGRFKKLNEVLKHYNTGIQQSKTLSKQLKKPLNLTDHQRTELLAFLKTLTDKEFLFHPKYGFPKNN